MNHSEGSAILIVMLFMSMLSIFCLSFWQSSALFHDISLQRLTYEQRYRVAEGGINNTLVFCRKHFGEIVQACRQTGKTYHIEMGLCKLAKNIVYKNTISVSCFSGALHVQSVLHDQNNKDLFCVSCDLIKSIENDKKEIFFVKHWNIGE